MADIWRAQITIDAGAGITGQLPDIGGDQPVMASRVLTATDSTGQLYVLEGRLQWNNFGVDANAEWVTAYYAALQGPYLHDVYDYPWYGPGAGGSANGLNIQGILTPIGGIIQSPLQILEADGNNGANWFAGGTLAIEKDFMGNTLTYITPLGNMVIPLDTFLPADNGPLLASGMGHGIAWGIDVDSSETQRWHDFQTYLNGVLFSSAALSTADPGFWGPWIPHTFTLGPLYNSIGANIPTADFQDTTRYQTEFIHTFGAADYSGTSEIRLGEGSPVAMRMLDMTAEHGLPLTWGVWAPGPGGTFLQVRRNDLFGLTAAWQDFVAVNGLIAISSPTIQVLEATVYVCYYDNASMTTRLVRSRDAGLSWSSPMPVSITGANPRLVISPEGAFFFFSLSGSTILLQRSFDVGATLFDASPIVVATAVPMQDFAAVIADNRRVLVAYADVMGNWTTRSSADFGLTWSTV
jgi:hypothetical protein